MRVGSKDVLSACACRQTSQAGVGFGSKTGLSAFASASRLLLDDPRFPLSILDTCAADSPDLSANWTNVSPRSLRICFNLFIEPFSPMPALGHYTLRGEGGQVAGAAGKLTWAGMGGRCADS